MSVSRGITPTDAPLARRRILHCGRPAPDAPEASNGRLLDRPSILPTADDLLRFTTPGMTPMIAVRPEGPTEAHATYFNADAADRARRAASIRAASGRRRRIDPTTCERDYSAEELEFMGAMDAYKRRSGRMFPTWSEVLEVVQSLGYAKAEVSGPAGAAP